MDTQKLHNLAEKMLEMPDLIQSNQVELLNLTEMNQKVGDEITLLESKIKAEIAAEVDENNKKVYTNSESRDSAFVERSSENQALISLKNSQINMQREINLRRYEIERLQNEQRNIRSVLDFFKSI
jgi:hypothetical protein